MRVNLTENMKEEMKPLGTVLGKSHAEEVAALDLKVGDTIRGKEEYADGWHEARLTILWIGREVVVYHYEYRSNHFPDGWHSRGETANFTLSCREWFQERTPTQPPPKPANPRQY